MGRAAYVWAGLVRQGGVVFIGVDGGVGAVLGVWVKGSLGL